MSSTASSQDPPHKITASDRHGYPHNLSPSDGLQERPNQQDAWQSPNVFRWVLSRKQEQFQTGQQYILLQSQIPSA